MPSPSTAAQYIRMSSDGQDLSPEMQMSAIEQYARRRGMAVVQTYFDSGRSGLTIEKRPQMRKLLQDVVDPHCAFSTILVYDVSRWGRFQDTDASAYYEYHCRLHGVDVRYVQEPYTDVDSPLSSLLKGYKRAMAADFSRELAVKVRAGQKAALDCGYHLGTLPALGIARVAVSKGDGTLRPLGRGEHKSAQREHVQWVLGPERELVQVRRIFHLYANTELSVVELADILQQEGIAGADGAKITPWVLYSLLRCEAMVGNFVWGRADSKKRRSEDDPRFRRVEGCLQPIVDQATFDEVQRKLADRGRHRYAKVDLLASLKQALERHPRLDAKDLRKVGLACRGTYVKAFGSVKAAWAAAGHSTRTFDRIDEERMRRSRLTCVHLCRCVELYLRSIGVPCEPHGRLHRKGQSLVLNGGVILKVQVIWREERRGSLQWRFVKKYKEDFHWALVVRVGEDGTAVDSLLLRRDEYFLTDVWMRDRLEGAWWQCRDDTALRHKLSALKGDGPSFGVPLFRPRKGVARERA